MVCLFFYLFDELLWLQTIQDKFEDFKRSVMAKADRFSEVDNFAKRLVAEGHTDTVIIKEQQDILRCLSFVIGLFYNIKIQYLATCKLSVAHSSHKHSKEGKKLQ